MNRSNLKRKAPARVIDDDDDDDDDDEEQEEDGSEISVQTISTSIAINPFQCGHYLYLQK